MTTTLSDMTAKKRPEPSAGQELVPVVIVHVILTGKGGAEGWLDIARDGMTVCKENHRKDVDLVVQGDTSHLYRRLSGIAPFREVVSAGLRRSARRLEACPA